MRNSEADAACREETNKPSTTTKWMTEGKTCYSSATAYILIVIVALAEELLALLTLVVASLLTATISSTERAV
jgi:hypothetical protein